MKVRALVILEQRSSTLFQITLPQLPGLIVSQPEHRYALPAGYRLHWYQIESILGKGGFGITYLARDLNLDKQVAIKEYLPGEFALRESDDSVRPLSDKTRDHFAWGLDRFIKEARTLSRFEHPHIVRVNAVFEENNTGYMVMAYEHGRSLKDILKEQGTLDEATLKDLILPVIDGLQRVHEKGFIHRDIKPDNIYVREDGSAVLLDFGSAREAAGGDQTMTSLVSPGYAPFEQYYAKGEEQGPWTDIYGLGATLYRAVTGKKPMDAVYRSSAMIDTQADSMESASTLAAGTYSDAFLAAIDHAVQFRPGDRPQSLTAWQEELLAQKPVFVPPEPLAMQQQTTAVVASEDDVTQIQQPVRRESTTQAGSKWRISAAIISLALLAMVGGAFVAFDDESLTAQIDLSDTPKPVAAPIESNPEVVIEPEPVSGPSEETLAERSEEALLLQQEQQEQEKLEAEKARIAEQQLLQEEAERLQEEQRLAAKKKAEEQRRQEQARMAAEKRRLALEKRIVESQQQMAARYGQKKDIFGYNDAREARSLTASQNSVTNSIPASTREWVNSGALIERGKTYRITASGQWKMGGFCNPSDATGKGIYTLACWDGGNQTVTGYSHGALIAKIGKETLAFYVGPSVEFTAASDGELYFMSNDAPAFIGDNSGALTVEIEYLPDN